MNKKSKEIVYRSPDGQRWRLTSTPKYGNKPKAVRIKDGHIRWKTDDLHELVEESVWLATKKKVVSADEPICKKLA